eukprot:gene22488-25482_t
MTKSRMDSVRSMGNSRVKLDQFSVGGRVFVPVQLLAQRVVVAPAFRVQEGDGVRRTLDDDAVLRLQAGESLHVEVDGDVAPAHDLDLDLARVRQYDGPVRQRVRRDQFSYYREPYELFLDHRRSDSRSGVFVQDEWRMRPGLLLNAGLRYDRDSNAGSQFHPRLALMYRASQDSTVKLIYGTAYRAPNAYELYYGYPGEGGQHANPELSAERIRTRELIFERRLDANGLARLSLFNYRMRGLISQEIQPDTGLLMFANIQRAVATGAEVAYERQFGRGLRLRASFAMQHADDGNNAQQLVEEELGGGGGVRRVLELALGREGVGVQPGQQAGRRRGDHVGLRIVHMGVDEAGRDHLAAIVVHHRSGRQRGVQHGIVASGLHLAIGHHQQTVLVPVVGVGREGGIGVEVQQACSQGRGLAEGFRHAFRVLLLPHTQQLGAHGGGDDGRRLVGDAGDADRAHHGVDTRLLDALGLQPVLELHALGLGSNQAEPVHVLALQDGFGEALVERVLDTRTVLAQVRASKSPGPGVKIRLADAFDVTVGERAGEFYTLHFDDDVFELIEAHGRLALPPYIQHAADEFDETRYQTVFNKVPGAVAAPTAGLHFDEALLHKLRDKGVNFAYVTLHVGAGTFQPEQSHGRRSDRHPLLCPHADGQLSGRVGRRIGNRARRHRGRRSGRARR